MARLIDADALYKEIERIYDEHYSNSSYKFIHDFFRAILRRIRKEPTVDAVPVVRCKDCKHYVLPEEFDACGRCTNGNICVSYGSEIYPEPGDFCSYGERRSNG